MKGLLLLLGVLLVALCASGEEEEVYSEEARLEALSDDALLSSFSFRWHHAAPRDHVRLLPKELGLILGRHRVSRLHLSFTQGRWLFERWGDSARHAPPGVTAEAEFQAHEGAASSEERWAALSHSLGGLFCATLQFLPRGNSWAPSALSWSGALAREAVCTENLTPFLKLLPCRDAAGLGRLLNPLKLYDVAYHSMQVRYSEGVLVLSLDVVTQASVRRSKPWTLHGVFGRSEASACPLASSSLLHVDGVAHDLAREGPFSGTVPERRSAELAQPWVRMSRFIEGYGQEKGAINLEVSNPSDSRALSLVITEVIPSEFKVFLHTLRPAFPAHALSVSPGEPTVISMRLELPANQSTRIRYEFHKNFLHWTRYPPDAHRGYDVPSSEVRNADTQQRVYTESLLALFPTPDFSMPFNVITLSGTLVGFFFGTVLGFLNQDFSPLLRGEQVKSTRPIARLARFVMRLIDGEE